MKRFLAMLLAMALTAGLTACGTSAQGAAASSAEASASTPQVSATPEPAPEETASSTESAEEIPADQGNTVNMMYFLDLRDGSIMAACYDDAGKNAMGSDYIKVYTDSAEITDADGNPMTVSDMVRGCFIEVTFPGMVTMSIPAQISATKIVVTDNTEHGVPDENSIPDLGSGKWWEQEVVMDAPDLTVQYKDSLGQYTQIIPYKMAAWSYEDAASQEGSATNVSMDGQTPQTWMFIENNTVKRTEFDTVKLGFTPAPDSMTALVYRQDDPADNGAEVQISEDGEITLPDSTHNWVYVVSCQWDSDSYQGEAIYGFLVTAAE